MRNFQNKAPLFLRVLFLSLATFSSISSFAKCASNGIFLLNPGKQLKGNGIVILEFFAASQSLIADLNKKYPISLKSKNTKIVLLVSEVLKGEFNITQVILRPATTLVEKEIYELRIDSLPAHEKNPTRLNKETGKIEAATFVAHSLVKTTSPILNDSISETGKSTAEYGCGPEKWVYFRIPFADISAPYVRASVKNTRTGKQTDYIFVINNETVKIGHGMCSGGFLFDTGSRYVVSFLLMDESGNQSDFSRVIPFKRP